MIAPVKPINKLWPILTKPAAGVITTKPTTAPIQACEALTLLPFIPSKIIQVNMLIAEAVLVVANAIMASEFAPKADPELNPNHPNHSIPVPSRT